MMKRILLLKGKPGLSRSEMLHYWQHTHAPLAMQFPEWFESTERYTQNHIGEQLRGEPFDFDGMVESWQRPAGAVGRSFPDSKAYAEVVGPDELNFVDRAASMLLFVEERPLIERTGAVKVFTFLARRAGITSGEFGERWLASHAAAVQKLPGFWARVKGYVQNLVVPGSMKVIGKPGAPPLFVVDGFEEMRFDSGDAMSAALASKDYAALEADQLAFCAPAIASIVVREVPLYDRSAGDKPWSS